MIFLSCIQFVYSGRMRGIRFCWMSSNVIWNTSPGYRSLNGPFPNNSANEDSGLDLFPLTCTQNDFLSHFLLASHINSQTPASCLHNWFNSFLHSQPCSRLERKLENRNKMWQMLSFNVALGILTSPKNTLMPWRTQVFPETFNPLHPCFWSYSSLHSML